MLEVPYLDGVIDLESNWSSYLSQVQDSYSQLSTTFLTRITNIAYVL